MIDGWTGWRGLHAAAPGRWTAGRSRPLVNRGHWLRPAVAEPDSQRQIFVAQTHVTVAEASGTFPFQGKETGSDNQDLDAARPGTPMDVTFSIGSEVRSSLAELVLLHFPIRVGHTFLTPATIDGQR